MREADIRDVTDLTHHLHTHAQRLLGALERLRPVQDMRSECVEHAPAIRDEVALLDEVSREGADSILKFSGFIQEPVPLINGIPISENVDLYLADNFTRKHSGARERPQQTYQPPRKKKS